MPVDVDTLHRLVLAHLEARDALEAASAASLKVDDPRFAAVADTLADLRAATLKESRRG